jgi:hypothetical protein
MYKLKLALVISFLLMGIGIYAEKVEIAIEYLSNKEIKVVVDDSIDEISGVKGFINFKKDGKVQATANNSSQIIKISNLERLNKIRKISLMGLLNGYAIGEIIKSPIIEEILIDYGISPIGIEKLSELTKLKILYISHSKLSILNNLDLSKTKLEYIEFSNCSISGIYNLKVPDGLRFANFMGNPGIAIDLNTIDAMNRSKTGVVLDDRYPGIVDMIKSINRYTRIGDYAQIGW